MTGTHTYAPNHAQGSRACRHCGRHEFAPQHATESTAGAGRPFAWPAPKCAMCGAPSLPTLCRLCDALANS